MSNPAAIDCPSCSGSGVTVERCDEAECAGYLGRSHDHGATCEQCEGQGGGCRCRGCSEFCLEPICADCAREWSSPDLWVNPPGGFRVPQAPRKTWRVCDACNRIIFAELDAKLCDECAAHAAGRI